MRPHRGQPTRLPRPWDSPGKNTGVDCHFLLQYVKVKSESEVAQSCPTLSDPMDCSLPGSPIHVIFQARVLERMAIAFSHSNAIHITYSFFCRLHLILVLKVFHSLKYIYIFCLLITLLGITLVSFLLKFPPSLRQYLFAY